ncbi:MAG: polyprenyl synthetase family protein [Parvibaculales bacterium]
MHHINEQAAEAAARVDKLLHDLLAVPGSVEGKIVEAMRYSILGGGKRFRAFLCCASANLFDVDPHHAARTAAAIECVHTYSLIHDDLPCMDDDDMRRGKPSLHRAYDEAIAVLAGDALLTLAFEILVDEQTHPRKAVRLDLIAGLAKAAGAQGMVGGQVFDMLSPELELDAGGLTHLQQMKTGALIRFSVEAGAVLGGATTEQRQALVSYANDIGLAFQIADDLLDIRKTSKELGKTAGKDAASGKVTFVSLLGEERANAQAEVLVEQAIAHLSGFGDAAQPLREAAKFVILRDN